VNKPRIILGITGASGAIYGVRALEALKDLGVETHLVISKAAELTLQAETSTSSADLTALAQATWAPPSPPARSRPWAC
jgi:4-hydroxy-3-polyprenylbenzoate decarboxylase